MLRRLIVGAALVAFFHAMPAYAQKARPAEPPTIEITPELHQQLVEMIHGLLAGMHERVRPGAELAIGTSDRVASLNEGGEDSSDYYVAPNMIYTFIGVCDNECSVLDLDVLGEDGRLVARYARSDDWPIIELRTDSPERFTAKLVLRECSIQPCYVGLRVLQRTP